MKKGDREVMEIFKERFSLALRRGLDDDLFAICVVLACIVMYDAQVHHRRRLCESSRLRDFVSSSGKFVAEIEGTSFAVRIRGIRIPCEAPGSPMVSTSPSQALKLANGEMAVAYLSI